MPIYYIDLTV